MNTIREIDMIMNAYLDRLYDLFLFNIVGEDFVLAARRLIYIAGDKDVENRCLESVEDGDAPPPWHMSYERVYL